MPDFSRKKQPIINIGTGIETSINTIFNEIRSLVAPGIPEVHGPAMPGEQLRSILSYVLHS